MKRRDAIKTAGLILGYAITAGTATAVLNGCNADPSTDWSPSFLNKEEAEAIKAISNAIVPSVDGKPGAKDVMMDKFFDETLSMYYTTEEQNKFREGMSEFASKVLEENGKSFKALSEDEQLEIIKKELEGGNDFIKKVHELSITGFCTSERGMKEVLVFDPIPGVQKGCIPFEEVGGIWAIS